jgi:putative spermidine/putrescine transport system ATP-binding protein
VRPEKISILDTGDAATAGDTVESGVIREVVYVGMFTRYIVELDSGGELTVVEQNLETSSQDALESRGRRVRLEWRPEHTYEIDPGGEA